MPVVIETGGRRCAPSNEIAPTTGRQLLALEDQAASTAIQPPNSEVEIDLTQEEAAWMAAQPEIVLGVATEYPPLVLGLFARCFQHSIEPGKFFFGADLLGDVVLYAQVVDQLPIAIKYVDG